jgi:hypothetical protein
MRSLLLSRSLLFLILLPYTVQGHFFGAYNLSENLEIHGYLSQGYVHTTDNDYFTTTKNGSFAFHEAGLNVTYDFSDCFRTGVQFYNRQYGAIGGYDVRVDWAYGDYRFSDQCGVRFGKVKIPHGLHNQWRDFDICRTFAILPQGVYTESLRDYFAGLWGVQLYGNLNLETFGDIDYQILYGVTDVDVEAVVMNDIVRKAQTALNAKDVQNASLETENMFYGSLIWNIPWLTARLGLTGMHGQGFLRFDFPALVGAGQGRWESDIGAESIVYSAEWSYCDFIFTGEYSVVRFPFRSNTYAGPGIPAIPGFTANSHRAWYVSGQYYVTPCIILGGYYSEYLLDQSDKGSLPENYQNDLTGTIRYDFNNHWAAKFELHSLKGHAQVREFDNPAGIQKNWFLAMFKLSTSF